MVKKAFLIVFLWTVVGISFGVAWYDSKNPESDITYVNFSKAVQELGGANTFSIPQSFHATYIPGGNSFSFHIPLSQRLSRLGADTKSMRIRVEFTENEKRMRSFYRMSELVDERIEEINVPYFSGYYGDFKVYEHEYSSQESALAYYYVKKDMSGHNIVITDPGDWSFGYRVYRQLNSNIELDYVFTKKIGIEEWDSLDNYILATLISFQ